MHRHSIETESTFAAISWKVEEGKYLQLGELLELIPNNAPLKFLLTEHWDRISIAKGSSHNHQAWEGGYLDHVVETMNIACQIYDTFTYEGMGPKRPLPFTLAEALVVMFLHDLEKPWKHIKQEGNPEECKCGHLRRDHWVTQLYGEEVKCIQCGVKGKSCLKFISINPPVLLATKQDRKQFRSKMIADFNIHLTDEQWNALRYVEGVPDDEYTPGERTMGLLAAFCHCCDILSARLWYDKGQSGDW